MSQVYRFGGLQSVGRQKTLHVCRFSSQARVASYKLHSACGAPPGQSAESRPVPPPCQTNHSLLYGSSDYVTFPYICSGLSPLPPSYACGAKDRTRRFPSSAIIKCTKVLLRRIAPSPRQKTSQLAVPRRSTPVVCLLHIKLTRRSPV